MSSKHAKSIWKCSECGEFHDHEDDARECCAPEVYEYFGCPECGMVHEEETDALQCCEVFERCPCCARDYGQTHLQAFAIRVAGHCNTCNPIFTLEQQLAIEDLHCAKTGERQRLNA